MVLDLWTYEYFEINRAPVLFKENNAEIKKIIKTLILNIAKHQNWIAKFRDDWTHFEINRVRPNIFKINKVYLDKNKMICDF